MTITFAEETAALFDRDLKRLIQEVAAFQDPDLLWKCVPGIANSAGNLALHLEGNLREYVGRLLGNVPYQRTRDQEFAAKGLSPAEITARLEDLARLIPAVIANLSSEQLQATYAGNPLASPLSTQHFLIHLYGHFNYHLGQINYLRRFLTA